MSSFYDTWDPRISALRQALSSDATLEELDELDQRFEKTVDDARAGGAMAEYGASLAEIRADLEIRRRKLASKAVPQDAALNPLRRAVRLPPKLDVPDDYVGEQRAAFTEAIAAYEELVEKRWHVGGIAAWGFVFAMHANIRLRAALELIDALAAKLAELETRSVGELDPKGTEALADAWQGTWQRGGQYRRGNLVAHAGSSWLAVADTEEQPGDGATSWRLIVKRGRDGRDAR